MSTQYDPWEEKDWAGAAERVHGSDEIEIDADGAVSIGYFDPNDKSEPPDGAWVRAWVWVDRREVEGASS